MAITHLIMSVDRQGDSICTAGEQIGQDHSPDWYRPACMHGGRERSELAQRDVKFGGIERTALRLAGST